MQRPMQLVGASGLLSACAIRVSGYGAQHLLVLWLMAPLLVLEEAVFRAGLHEALLHHWQARPGLANIATATAAVFALSHVVLHGDASALAVPLPALVMGRVYQRTGRLRWWVALHAAMSAVWLGWNATGPSLLNGRGSDVGTTIRSTDQPIRKPETDDTP
jgi:membrane protease YdiL (CAAX protease family)